MTDTQLPALPLLALERIFFFSDDLAVGRSRRSCKIFCQVASKILEERFSKCHQVEQLRFEVYCRTPFGYGGLSEPTLQVSYYGSGDKKMVINYWDLPKARASLFQYISKLAFCSPRHYGKQLLYMDNLGVNFSSLVIPALLANSYQYRHCAQIFIDNCALNHYPTNLADFFRLFRDVSSVQFHTFSLFNFYQDHSPIISPMRLALSDDNFCRFRVLSTFTLQARHNCTDKLLEHMKKLFKEQKENNVFPDIYISLYITCTSQEFFFTYTALESLIKTFLLTRVCCSVCTARIEASVLLSILKGTEKPRCEILQMYSNNQQLGLNIYQYDRTLSVNIASPNDWKCKH